VVTARKRISDNIVPARWLKVGLNITSPATTTPTVAFPSRRSASAIR
jgi:hypothetical protein